MSRPPRHPAPGETPVPGEPRPVPTKEQILLLLDSASGVLMTKPATLLACARLFQMPPGGHPTESWARQVIDYAATQRLFEKMAQDGLIVGKPAYVWREHGVSFSYLQPGATYYATARRALEISEKLSDREDARLWEQAEDAARHALARRHPDQYRQLVQECYDKLRQQEG